MADEQRAIARYRFLYRKLLRCYSKSHRERFGESMEQTFNDLCRERVRAGRGLGGLVVWTFVETSAGILRENATNMMRCTMKQGSTQSLKVVKYSAITVGALMVAGIITLMVLARGTGEDITGIVAPALLITIVSSIVAVVAAVFQWREKKSIDIKPSNSNS
jgi:hypothetical protein